MRDLMDKTKVKTETSNNGLSSCKVFIITVCGRWDLHRSGQLNASHHLHQPYAPQRYNAKPAAPIQPQQQPPPSPKKLAAASAGAEVPETGDDYGESAYQDVNPFSADENSNPFNPTGSDPGKSRADLRSDKRKSQDELSD
ncbi:hypothetical protein CRG98_007062, partial [Punica granatum]